MGCSIAWLAVPASFHAQILDALALELTGEREEIWESELVGAHVGSSYVVGVPFEHTLVSDRTLARISSLCEVISAGAEEHVMVSTASAWKGGRLIWRITHDSEESRNDLQVEGTPPSQFAPIRQRLMAEQEALPPSESFEVDVIFNIPLELAETLTGFSHENDIDGDHPYEVLRNKPQRRPPL